MGAFFNVLVGRRMGLRAADLAKESVNSDSFAGVRHLVRTVILGTFLVELLGTALLAITFVPRLGLREGIRDRGGDLLWDFPFCLRFLQRRL